MEVTIVGFDNETAVVEVGLDDTVLHLRRKVASAVGLPEDGFHMSFGGDHLDEGSDMTQLSAGDEVVLIKNEKYDAVAELLALGETEITEQRLESVGDAEVACLLLRAVGATVIPDGFLWETLVTKVDLSAASPVTKIGKSFLSDCYALETLDLSGLGGVTKIDDHFLAYCGEVTALDLSSLRSVTHVGSFFLYRCVKLETLDVSGLNVTHIRPSFIAHCEALTALELPSLCSVTRVGDSFLACCLGLKALDLSGLSNVTHIEHYFLGGCEALAALDLSPLRNVTQVGDSFLEGCACLETLDLSPLSKATQVGRQLLTECYSLQAIHLSGGAVATVVQNSKPLQHLVAAERSAPASLQPRKRRRHGFTLKKKFGFLD